MTTSLVGNRTVGIQTILKPFGVDIKNKLRD